MWKLPSASYLEFGCTGLDIYWHQRIYILAHAVGCHVAFETLPGASDAVHVCVVTA